MGRAYQNRKVSMAKTAGAKTKVYSRYGREIYVSAKNGGPGAVAHMFDHQAVFVFKGDDEDAVLEALMMADIDVSDIECEDDIITVLTPNTEVND